MLHRNDTCRVSTESSQCQPQERHIPSPPSPSRSQHCLMGLKIIKASDLLPLNCSMTLTMYHAFHGNFSPTIVPAPTPHASNVSAFVCSPKRRIIKPHSRGGHKPVCIQGAQTRIASATLRCCVSTITSAYHIYRVTADLYKSERASSIAPTQNSMGFYAKHLPSAKYVSDSSDCHALHGISSILYDERAHQNELRTFVPADRLHPPNPHALSASATVRTEYR
ncbi:hypothetical protein eimer1623h09.tmp0011 [Eimeria tenella]|uniref:Uncharacterized protein n=1 Tax=Eimeria tenella TaxID=5802 RepID=C8TDJ2_EIMTE|nr:hypothetical protein eimer1623h09.tmp0011 [Eimeria tenella]